MLLYNILLSKMEHHTSHKLYMWRGILAGILILVNITILCLSSSMKLGPAMGKRIILKQTAGSLVLLKSLTYEVNVGSIHTSCHPKQRFDHAKLNALIPRWKFHGKNLWCQLLLHNSNLHFKYKPAWKKNFKRNLKVSQMTTGLYMLSIYVADLPLRITSDTF